MTDRHRPDPLEDVLIEEGRLPPRRRSFQLADIEPGWDVLGNGEEVVGRVAAVEEECLLVRRGLLASKLYVPLSAIGEVREGAVVLNVPAKWIPAMGWTQPPRFEHVVSSDRAGGHRTGG